MPPAINGIKSRGARLQLFCPVSISTLLKITAKSIIEFYLNFQTLVGALKIQIIGENNAFCVQQNHVNWSYSSKIVKNLRLF